MIRRATALRRIVASGNKIYNRKSNARSFHTTGVMAGDALDMVDTFARRHSKFHPEKIFDDYFCRILFLGLKPWNILSASLS